MKHVIFLRIGKTKVDALNDAVEETTAYLLQEPVETIEFVQYLEYVEEATGRVDDMELEYDYCKELYDITEEFEIPTALDDVQLYLGLSVTLGNLRNLVDKKLEETGKIIKQFGDQLNKDISNLISSVGTIKDECMVSSRVTLPKFIYED